MDDRRLAAELRDIVGPRFVLTDESELRAYECDGNTIFKKTPRIVVLPESTEQVSRIVRLLASSGIAFIPRGAGTGLSSGVVPMNGEVMIGLSRLNHLLELDLRNRVAVVEAGFPNLKITQMVQDKGLYFAPDPSSQPVCTIGGNVAENAGGAHCLKYGVTTNHVLGLTVVTPEGEVIRLGGKTTDTPGYDLVGLMVGSEGTMGIVTEVMVRLSRRPQGFKTVMALFDSISQASDAVSGVIAAGILPGALEIMDKNAIIAVERGPLRVGYPEGQEAVLLIDVDGLSAGLDAQVEAILKICREAGCTEVRPARSPEERLAWWTNRKGAFGAAGNLAPSYVVQDGVIPRSKLTEVLEEVGSVGKKYDLTIANVFHAGDGNLHPLICYDDSVPGNTDKALKAGSEILAACVKAGGTISGEHGIGIEKMQDMKVVFTADEIAVQKAVHDALDPRDLCNPGKIFPA
ncbi:MAG TPA: FAD-linked oxidase C-terminal domain-containing protein [Bryobacteraceae bacterium]|nr:FAD-linked oxidase C-terminal domain-containing protein [Bryobacteraceae bacterium]